MFRGLLLFTAVVAATIGTFACIAPASLLTAKGVADIDPAAVAMTRTVGVALLGVASLDFACRDLRSSPTLRRVLGTNAMFQLLLTPLDPYAYAVGAFSGVASFLPNTVLHIVLATVFARAWWTSRTVVCPR
ncbi:MAG: hypothetical protein K0V04_13665 [Deltaproteobacteria bacterium]|nr:hypothetical protein [Deltaproteobacteria bacterium]